MIIGSLDYCSAFRFENHLQILKKSIQETKSPLLELINRIYKKNEISLHRKAKHINKNKHPNNYYFNNNTIIEILLDETT